MGISHLLNFIRYYKKQKNIVNLRLILETKLKPRQDRSQKNSKKKCFKKEERKAKKIFYKKLQILQTSRVSIPFET